MVVHYNLRLAEIKPKYYVPQQEDLEAEEAHLAFVRLSRWLTVSWCSCILLTACTVS